MNAHTLAIATLGLETLCATEACLNGTSYTFPASMANQQRQFSVINNPKSQGRVPMPEMGGSLSCGVSDTAAVPAVLQCWQTQEGGLL